MFGSWRRNERSAEAEVQTDVLFHLNLVDTGEVELDRIFSRHDVDVAGVDSLKC